MSARRGQPPKIGPEHYPALLELLTSGLSIPAAAREMGFARATLYHLAVRDEAMGEAMRAAQATGRAARHEPSESCYVNHACRSPECTQAATEARARRRAAETTPAAPYELVVGGERVTVYDLVADDDAPPLADSA